MHHALSTVEILTEILENCDQNSLTAAIVVSNRWHEVTKRLMWSTCSAANVAALFGMLGWYEPDYTWKAYDTVSIFTIFCYAITNPFIECIPFHSSMGPILCVLIRRT